MRLAHAYAKRMDYNVDVGIIDVYKKNKEGKKSS